MKKTLRIYYLKTFGPLLLITALMLTSRVPLFELGLFLFGAIWMIAYYTPYLKERSEEHKYRYSFLKFFYFIHRPLLSYFPERMAITLTLIFVFAVWFAALKIPLHFLLFPVLGTLCWAPGLLKLSRQRSY